MAINALIAICKDVSLPESSGQWLLDQLEQDQQKEIGNLNQLKAKLNSQIDESNARLNKILNLFLDNTITREEYLGRKNELMSNRKTMEEQLLNLSGYQNDNIERAKDFVRLTIQAGKISKQYLKIAEKKEDRQNRIEPIQPPLLTQEPSQIPALTLDLAEFLKKAELNLFLKDRKVYHIKQKPWAALGGAAPGRILVDPRGFEPLISSMPWKRDSRYATGPWTTSDVVDRKRCATVLDLVGWRISTWRPVPPALRDGTGANSHSLWTLYEKNLPRVKSRDSD